MLPALQPPADTIRDATIQNRQMIEETLRRLDKLDSVELDKRVSVVETKLTNIDKEVTAITAKLEKFQWGIIGLLLESVVRIYGQFKLKAKNDE